MIYNEFCTFSTYSASLAPELVFVILSMAALSFVVFLVSLVESVDFSSQFLFQVNQQI